jgi:hypothetical protein
MSDDSKCRYWDECTNPANKGWCDDHRYMPADGVCQHPDGCEMGVDAGPAPVQAKGLCSTHHQRWWTKGDLGPVGRLTESQQGKTCKHPDDCPEPAYQRGWCRMHMARVRRDGQPGPVEPLKRSNGEGNLDSRGYVRMTVDYQRIQAHRYVMEQALGRPLRDFENVHHINGIRSDNRPENLELWVKAQPAGQRARDLAEWVLDTYPELVEAVLADRRQLRLIVSNQ